MGIEYRRVADVEVAPMLEETILYHPGKQQFCVLNNTAALLWDRMENPTSAGELVAALMDGFSGVDSEAAEQDVASALEQLQDLELIEPHTHE